MKKPRQKPYKILRQILCFCKRLIIILLLVALVAFAGAIGWLSSGARQIAPLNTIFSKHIAERIGANAVKMHNPTLFINLKNYTLELELSDVEAILPNAVSQIKTAKVAVSIASLLKWQPAYSNLEVRHFNLSLPNSAQALHIPELSLQPNAQNNNKNHLKIALQTLGQPAGEIIADIKVNPKTIVANADIKAVPAALLQIIAPEIGEIDASMNVAIEAVWRRNLQLIFARGKFDIEALQLQHVDFYPDENAPLKLQNIKADVEWERKKNMVLLHDLQANSNEMTLNLQGQLLPDLSKAELHGEITQMQVKKLVQLWPKQVANEARIWVDEHILAGLIKEAIINIHHNSTTKADIMLQVRDAEIEYAKHLPKAYAANGEVKITENSMAININSAKNLSTIHVKDGFAEIPSFTDAAVPMRFNLPIIADAKDVAIFLSAKHLNKASELRLKPEAIKGKVNGVLTLDFPLYPERAGLGKSSFDNLLFSIKAKITGLQQADLFGVWDLQGFNGELDMDNDAVSANAKGLLNNAPIILQLKHLFAKKTTNYEFDLRLNDAQFVDFAIALPADMVQGEVVIKGKMQQNNTSKQTQATIDLSDAKIDLAQYGWSKKRGKQAILQVQEQYDGTIKTIEMLHLQAGDEEIKGAIKMSASGEIATLDLPLVRTKHADLAMKYVATTRPELTLKGRKLDIGWLQPAEPSPTSKTSKTIKPIYKQNPLKMLMNKQINIELETLVSKDKTLRDFSLKTDCVADYCPSAKMKADYDKHSKIQATIHQDGGKRVFVLQGDDFGSAIKAVSGNANFKGGSFSVRGDFADGKPNKPLVGRMVLQNVQIIGAPILTRLLTLASLTGIADVLMGDGIGFDKISADIDYDDNRIMFAKGAAKGDALGIMFEGMLQPFGFQRQKLKGTVIPSYALNSLPSKVPLLGLLIGEEGEGVFATRFSVDGTLSNPDVMANPLSMITPGFLRNIFEIFPDVTPLDDNLVKNKSKSP